MYIKFYPVLWPCLMSGRFSQVIVLVEGGISHGGDIPGVPPLYTNLVVSLVQCEAFWVSRSNPTGWSVTHFECTLYIVYMWSHPVECQNACSLYFAAVVVKISIIWNAVKQTVTTHDSRCSNWWCQCGKEQALFLVKGSRSLL